MVSSNRASFSSSPSPCLSVWGGQAAVFLVVILFNPLLDEPGGPRGINYQGRYRPRATGGMWWWWSFGGSHQTQPELDPQREEETERKWWGRGGDGGRFGGRGGRPSALAYKPQSKELFHTPPNTCCHWQMYKCVNTLEAYRETQTGLGIVMCKRQPLSKRTVSVRMKSGFVILHACTVPTISMATQLILSNIYCFIVFLHLQRYHYESSFLYPQLQLSSFHPNPLPNLLFFPCPLISSPLWKVLITVITVFLSVGATSL